MPSHTAQVHQIVPFIQDAVRAGWYTAAQGQNLKTALGLVLKEAANQGIHEPQNMPFDAFAERAIELLQQYAQRTGVSTASATTYESRVRRLIADFQRLGLSDKPIPRVQARAHTTRGGTSEAAEQLPLPLSFSSYPLGLPGSGWELRVPRNATKGDLDVVWEQLEALRTYLRTSLPDHPANPGVDHTGKGSGTS